MAAVANVMGVSAVTVPPDATVKDAIARMVRAGVGAVTVCDGPRLVGIFTERDVLRLAGEGARLDALPVAEVMTRELVTIPPDTEVLHAAELMGRHRIRHLPVVEDGNLLGVLGIRDVMSVLVEKLWAAHDPQARRQVQELLSRAPGPLHDEETA